MSRPPTRSIFARMPNWWAISRPRGSSSRTAPISRATSTSCAPTLLARWRRPLRSPSLSPPLLRRVHPPWRQAPVSISASALETRQSHGLDQFCASLEERPGMSILDFAGASQATVSFITSYGHRLYSDDFVHQLDQVFGPSRPGVAGESFFENQANPLLVSDFFAAALNFEDETFDGALVWDSLQFLASPLLQTVVAKLHRMLRPGASLLALFHTE